MKPDQITIRRALPDDSNRIYELSLAYAFTQNIDVSRDGFLVSSYTQAHYEDFIVKADYFYVAEQNDLVVAFIMAYPSSLISDETIRELTKRHVDTNFVLIKQICVDPEHTKQGIAGRLYEHLSIHTRPMPLLAAIVLEPENSASISFHNKLGFNKLFEFVPDDGMLRGMWAKGV